MDIRARFIGLAPSTDTGDPTDCSWLAKAAAMGAFDQDTTDCSSEADDAPLGLRIATIAVVAAGFFTLLALYFRAW